MPRQSRHQSVVVRQSDEPNSENHWLHEFEKTLQKSSVQPRGKSVFEEITSIMNSKSKYPSVQAAVDDMMHRSGLTTYLETVKESQERIPEQIPTKTAQVNELKHEPKALKIPGLKKTLDNIVRETKGNLPLSAIIRRLQAMYSKDSSDEGVWDDEDLIRLVSQCNLEAKKNNPGVFDDYSSLGKSDHVHDESDMDPSNTDAFNILMPAKI